MCKYYKMLLPVLQNSEGCNLPDQGLWVWAVLIGPLRSVQVTSKWFLLPRDFAEKVNGQSTDGWVAARPFCGLSGNVRCLISCLLQNGGKIWQSFVLINLSYQLCILNFKIISEISFAHETVSDFSLAGRNFVMDLIGSWNVVRNPVYVMDENIKPFCQND